MTPGRAAREVILSEAVIGVVEQFRSSLSADAHIWGPGPDGVPTLLYPRADAFAPEITAPLVDSLTVPLDTRDGAELVIEIRAPVSESARTAAPVLGRALEYLHEYS